MMAGGCAVGDRAKVCRLRSWALQEPEIERYEYQDNSDVYDQPLPEVVPEEQDVHADHDGYQREHVKHDGGRFHRFVLVSATVWSENGTGCAEDRSLAIAREGVTVSTSGPSFTPSHSSD